MCWCAGRAPSSPRSVSAHRSRSTLLPRTCSIRSPLNASPRKTTAMANPPALMVRRNFPRPLESLVNRLREVPTGWVVDANGRRGAVDLPRASADARDALLRSGADGAKPPARQPRAVRRDSVRKAGRCDAGRNRYVRRSQRRRRRVARNGEEPGRVRAGDRRAGARHRRTECSRHSGVRARLVAELAAQGRSRERSACRSTSAV